MRKTSQSGNGNWVCDRLVIWDASPVGPWGLGNLLLAFSPLHRWRRLIFDDTAEDDGDWLERNFFYPKVVWYQTSTHISQFVTLRKQLSSVIGGEQRRNQEFRFRFRQCRYRNFWQEKTGKFVNLWIDFREDIFPVYFYSESESYSLKSIQRITNSLAFSCQKFRYRHCRNRNRNSWFLLCSPPNMNLTLGSVVPLAMFCM